jgi:hypothetical protein
MAKNVWSPAVTQVVRMPGRLRSSYLPVLPLNDTYRPEGYGKDVITAISQIDEMWRLRFPLLPYYQLLKKTTPSPGLTDPVSDDENAPTGEIGASAFDPIWGESIPSDLSTWEQPHGDDEPDAPRPELHADPVKLHIRIQRENLEQELKKYGFDEVRDMIGFIPLSHLDAAGVRVQNGDYLIWDDDEYEILQHDRVGYWKNTNLRLYMLLNLQHRRAGS